MIEQQGQIVGTSGDLASVRLGGYSGCPACDEGKGCGAGIFGRLLNKKPVILELPNPLETHTGQSVIVGLPEFLLLRLVFRLYLFPLLSGLAGAVAGHYLSVRTGAGPAVIDGASLLCALLAGAGMLIWNRRRESEFPGKNTVHLLRRADRPYADSCAGKYSMIK